MQPKETKAGLINLIWIFMNAALFTIMLAVRDIRLISVMRDKSSEFSEIALLCFDDQACFRILPSWIGYGAQTITSRIALLLSENPDPFGSVPVLDNDRTAFINFTVSLFFRIGCIAVVFLCLVRLLNSLRNALVFLFLFQIVLIAPQSRIQGYASSLITDRTEIIDWFYRSNLVYFVFYDFIAVALILLTVVYWERLLAFSNWKFVSIGFLLFVSFDYLPIFLALMLLLSRKLRSFSNVVATLTPGGAITLYAFIAGDDGPKLSDTFTYYVKNNFENIMAIPVLIVLVFIPPILLGFAFKKFASYFQSIVTFQIDTSVRQTIVRAILALSCISLLSIFTSNFVGELARQTLALQLLLLIYFGTRIEETRK